MRKVTKTIVEINGESGVRLILCRNVANKTIFLKAYFKDEPISAYDLTYGDSFELINALQELVND